MFQQFLNSLKRTENQSLIEAIQKGYQIIFEANLTLYRGVSTYNKNGNYYTTDKEWARQFTQSGRDQEIITTSIPKEKILKLNPLPQATNEEDFDKALETAKQKGYPAVWFDEGAREPNSIFVLNKTVLESTESLQPIKQENLPVASNTVDGLTIRTEIPNTSSISSSFDNYKILPHVRELSLKEWEASPEDTFTTSEDIQRVKELAETIKQSKEINPLIIELNKKGELYVVEGVHRLSALYLLGKKSFPALVVLNLD